MTKRLILVALTVVGCSLAVTIVDRLIGFPRMGNLMFLEHQVVTMVAGVLIWRVVPPVESPVRLAALKEVPHA